jgi:prephenate dehydrogenase
MNAVKLQKIVLLGTGLIAGSFSLALRRARLVEQVIGVGRSAPNLARAIELRVIDVASHDAATAVQEADLVFLGTPVGQMGALLQQIAPHLKPTCLVTDGGSTKQDVCELYRQFLPQHLAYCVPGHPIAGSDLSGASAASYGLYEGRRVVLTPLAETLPASTAAINALWQACGAVVHEMDAATHDGVFAAVSHIPHLVSFAYMNAVLAKDNAAQCLDFAGTGFRDFTRIAGSHPEMWRDITLANQTAILADLQANVTQLQSLIGLIQAGETSALTEYIHRASQARSAWGKRPSSK